MLSSMDLKRLQHDEMDLDIPNLSPASVSNSSDSYGSNHSKSSSCASSLNSLPIESNCDRLVHLPKEIRTRKVSFGDVEIRTFPVIIGDHPDCVGPPITFDWDYVRQESVSLEEYEHSRPPRRRDEELILDWSLRKRLLRCYAGVTEEELQENAKQMQRIRKQREQTLKSIKFKYSVRHVLSKATMGLVSDPDIKHRDRGIHERRWKMNESPAVAAK